MQIESDNSPPRGPPRAEAPVVESAQRLYARIWRWHFFAALVVIPFVLWQSVTGVLYLWHDDLAVMAHPELMRVESGAAHVDYEQQLATVRSHQPGARLDSIEISDQPTRSTAFSFKDNNGLPYPAFVNPHTGEYLGMVESTHWLRGLTRGLHGGWPIQPYGSYLLELGASWAIVMMLTGFYLWWPRNARGFAGVLYPRLRSGSRVLWRDLHATVGVYFALIVLAFLFTALPWTTFWGQQVLGRVTRATGQESPTAFFFRGGGGHGAAHAATQVSGDHEAAPMQARLGADQVAVDTHTQVGSAHSGAPPPPLTLDTLIASARAAGVHGMIEVHPLPNGRAINIRDQQPHSSDEVWLQLDAQSGAVLTKVVWQDFPVVPKLVALGVDLHEGTFFGRANQIFNTIVASSLVWLTITGFIGWYKRRPHGGFAAPPKRSVRYPKAVTATAVALCIVLPFLGLSVLIIALIDRTVGGKWGHRTPDHGAPKGA